MSTAIGLSVPSSASIIAACLPLLRYIYDITSTSHNSKARQGKWFNHRGIFNANHSTRPLVRAQ